jgi:hypothetical protein
MITAKLMGGLGNQLFQIFATIATAIKLKKQFYFIYSDVLYSYKNRPTYWNTLMSSIKDHTVQNHKHYGDKLVNFYETHGYYNEINDVPPADSTLVLNGYYQHYKYFFDYQQEIYKMINLYEQLDDTCNKSPKWLENAISIHFRLDDFVISPDYHNILKVDYYIKCIRQIKSEDATVNNVLVFYQITDTELAETRFMEPLRHEFPELTFIVIDHNVPDWKQMLTMAICKYNVIANSTFSWWGAYFNQNPDKRVFYPALWFISDLTDEQLETMFPPEWTHESNITL